MSMWLVFVYMVKIILPEASSLLLKSHWHPTKTILKPLTQIPLQSINILWNPMKSHENPLNLIKSHEKIQ